MRSANKLEAKSPMIVRRVSIADTLRNISPGTSVKFNCREFESSLNSVRAVITRLNSNAGKKEFSVVSSDFGENYTVSRAK